MPAAAEIEVFSTAPQSADLPAREYVNTLLNVARWSEAYGCKGILVYSDNRLVDPWLAAQLILAGTQHLCPLVAVQPVYMHPYAVAKMVSSLAHMHGRRTYLNMIAGGFRNDLLALNDQTPHDERYARLCEYTRVILELLQGEPTTLEGRYYSTQRLQLRPQLEPSLFPGLFVSGSSEAGLRAARTLGATAIKYPQPSHEQTVEPDHAGPSGIRIGVIARETDAEAWQVAHARFPEDRKGRLTHRVAMEVSDSQWHQQLTLLSRVAHTGHNPYWLWPFENYKTFCPYLVGNYTTIARELAAYVGLGFTTFVLDIPPDEQELYHTQRAFQAARQVPQPLKDCAPGLAT